MSSFEFEIVKKIDHPAFKPHVHPHYEIYYLLEGSRDYLIGNLIYKICSGSFIFIKPNVIHKTEGGSYSRFLISFDEEFAKKLPSNLLNDLFNKEHIPLPKKMQPAFLEILSLFKNTDTFSDEERILYAQNVLSILFLSLKKAQQEISYTPSEKFYPKPVVSVIAFLQENYMREISLKELSEHAFVSPAYLCRIFKKYTNVNIFEYLNVIRLNKSIEMINQTHKSISEIALATGFSSVNYFSIQFKKHLNTTPSLYKKTLHKV